MCWVFVNLEFGKFGIFGIQGIWEFVNFGSWELMNSGQGHCFTTKSAKDFLGDLGILGFWEFGI